MKRILYLSLTILIAFLIIMLFVQNGESVEVKFLVWRFKSTLALFSVLAFGLGSILTLITTFPIWLQKRKQVINIQNELNSVLKNSITATSTLENSNNSEEIT
jgi:uncharacterized integral membrane protein